MNHMRHIIKDLTNQTVLNKVENLIPHFNTFKPSLVENSTEKKTMIKVNRLIFCDLPKARNF